MLSPFGSTPAAAAAATFTNPILPGFHADPSLCRVGEDYYLATSSFEYFPGVPIYHSRDLVNWRQIGYGLTRKSQLNLDRLRASQGIFAPTLRHHHGVFYLITTVVGGGGNFYVTAPAAAGPWSDPVWLDRDGFDPSLCFAPDGQVYYTRHADGERGYVGQQLLDLAPGKLAGPLQELWRGTGGIWPEGPHLYQIHGRYYLLISEGGTSYDHSLTVARSDAPWGPFEPNPKNPILTHKHLPAEPFQALGHGDLVETPAGWWITFLGIRPQGGRYHHLGRETFLAPVTWEDGWPVVNGGQPIPATLPAPNLPPHPWPAEPARDEFDTPTLCLAWQHVRNPVETDYSLTARPGWLRLQGAAATLTDVDSPTFVGQPQTALHGRAATQLSFLPHGPNEEAGLVLRGNDQNHYEIGLTRRAGERQVFFRKVLAGKVVAPVVYAPAGDRDPILTIQADPLRYEFFYSAGPGQTISLGTATTRDLATEQMNTQPGAGFNFTGVYLGLFASGNGQRSVAPADFDWFEYQPGQV